MGAEGKVRMERRGFLRAGGVNGLTFKKDCPGFVFMEESDICDHYKDGLCVFFTGKPKCDDVKGEEELLEGEENEN